MHTAKEVTAAIVKYGDSRGELATTTTRDQHLIGLWLNGLSRHTQRGYRREVRKFLAATSKEIREITLGDVQAYGEQLEQLELAAGSRHYALSAIKSLFAFGLRIGYLAFDVARVLRMPAHKETLNERILEEHEVAALINAAATPRDKLILQLVYIAGLRVSELCAMKWKDAAPHRGGATLTIFGKGGKTRAVRIEPPTWSSLQMARMATAADDAPIFTSRRRGHLHPSTVLRIVKAAAKRAGIVKPVSSHWLRHCHASHALDNGAPIHLVQQTLGHASVATTSRYLHARPNESSSKFLKSAT